jgi:hypothetical protein
MGGAHGTIVGGHAWVGASATDLDFVFVSIPATPEPLTPGPPGSGASLSAPLAYIFDPQSNSPEASPPACVAPSGYRYDPARDPYRLDEQGPIFTALPDGPDYESLVTEVRVTAHGEPCQAVKSVATLRARTAATVAADGKTAILGIVGPGVSLQLQGGTDVTARVEHVGWYQGYRVPYLDAGYAPTSQRRVPGMGGGADQTITELSAQILYVPDTVPDGMGGLRAGHLQDFISYLQFGPTDAHWSQIAHVLFFHPPDPMNLPTSFAGVDPTTVQPDTFEYIAIIPILPAMP